MSLLAVLVALASLATLVALLLTTRALLGAVMEFQAFAHRVHAQLLEALTARPTPEPAPEYWTGAFLPTDAAQAELEQRVRAAEDHAIQAGAPGRFSPSASSPSGARPASRRAVPPSGSG